MKEVIAIIRPEKWEATREAANALGIQEAVQRRVLGRGRQRGLRYLRPLAGGEEGGMQFLPKRMVEWIVPDEDVDRLVSAILRINCANSYGDGKIFVCPSFSYSLESTGKR